MAYEVNASRLTRTVVRINSTVKNIEADKFSATLEELNTLNTKAEQADFKSSLDTFLNTNPTFKEAFKYEGIFGRVGFIHTDSYDIDRSKKILNGLILAVGNRIDHLNTQKNKVSEKINTLFKKIDNYEWAKEYFPLSVRHGDTPSIRKDNMIEYHNSKPPKNIPEYDVYYWQKFKDFSKPRETLINSLTPLVDSLNEINAELLKLDTIQRQAAQALTELERPWDGLFNTYLGARPELV